MCVQGKAENLATSINFNKVVGNCTLLAELEDPSVVKTKFKICYFQLSEKSSKRRLFGVTN